MFHTKSHTRYQSDLDVYVSSKHPKTAADVDYWVIIKFLKQYFINQKQKSYADEILQYAKAEYGLEWQHAYHMMLQGKRPQPNGRVK